MSDDLDRPWMPDEAPGTAGPTDSDDIVDTDPEEITEAAKEAAKVPPEPVPGADGLPEDVRDGDLSGEEEVPIP